jgi:hypothetical protein
MRPEIIRASMVSVVMSLTFGCAVAPQDEAEVGSPSSQALVQQFENPDDPNDPLIAEATIAADAFDSVLTTSRGEVLFMAHFDRRSEVLSFAVQTEGSAAVLSEGSVDLRGKPIDAAGLNMFSSIGFRHAHAALVRGAVQSLPEVGKDVPYACGRQTPDPEHGQCTYSWDGPLPWNWTYGQWQGCCVTHDQQYASGGNGSYKTNVDNQLWSCIMSKGGNSFVGGVYYAAVQAFGYQYFNWRC